jgi:asparagine synthase (glutamine-hydrolysing)
MLDQMRHRGPDGHGVASLGGDAHGVAHDPAIELPLGRAVLGHLRLAILDLSPAGLQPMADDRDEIFVSFNGELFNFQILRAELEARGHAFRSQTDTEVLVHGWREWGTGLISRIEGMFAFILHDTRTGETVIVRDRVGVKPLYYATRPDGVTVVASEVKALFAAGVPPAVDPAGLDMFLKWLWVPDPVTAFRGVKKLPAGHFLRVGADGERELVEYWDFEFDTTATPADGAGVTRAAVTAAVERQLISDVPLGAFFSGGLDSTAIVELMRRSERQPPTCFTVGFTRRDLSHDVIVDDVHFAREYAATHELDYHEETLQPRVSETLPDVIWHMDEPIGDPAALSAFLIAQRASDNLTVLLSGMGGDEVFGGYPRYLAALYARTFRRLPRPVRQALHSTAAAIPGAGAGRIATVGRNAQKFLRTAERPFPHDYVGFLTYLPDDARSSLYAADWRDGLSLGEASRIHDAYLARVAGEPWLNQAMYLDLKTFLPSLNLTYMDKMSMAHSIESRVPLLDERVLEVARRIPPEDRLRYREGKLTFKRAMRGVVPDRIIDRKKAGFSAPARGWLRHELAPMVDELLGPGRIRERGILNPSAVKVLIDDFRTGRRDNALQIWQLLTLELWLATFIDAPAPSRVVLS